MGTLGTQRSVAVRAGRGCNPGRLVEFGKEAGGDQPSPGDPISSPHLLPTCARDHAAADLMGGEGRSSPSITE